MPLHTLLHTLLEERVVVLTASRRLAHAVRVRFAQHQQSLGRTVWRSPQVLPWSAWLRQQRLTARASRSDLDDTRLLTAAQARVLWDDIVAHSRWGRELLVPANAARLAARSWQRLHDYLIPLERLLESDALEARALHDWAHEFIRRCSAMRAVDDARLAHWMHDTQFVPSQRLALAGFDITPPAIARLIERWRAEGKISDPGAAPAATSVASAAAADVDAEIELAAQWARTQVEAGKTSVGMIIGDLQSRRETVRRVFEDTFAPGLRDVRSEAASIPVVIAAPAPLASYPLVDAALIALRLAVAECDSTVAGRLLRSPFIAGADSERSRRALADLRLRAEQRDRWDWFELERWASVANCERLALAAREVVAGIRGRASAATPSEWAERFQALLSQIGWPGDRTLTSIEHQTLAKFQDALAEFGTLDAVVARLGASGAFSRFHELLRDTPFEPETAQGSVIVIDATTSAGMQFDAVWITGLQADRFPAPVAPDAFIPLELQRAAGVPEATPASALQLATLQLDRWLRSAPDVVLSWPEREQDAELTISPLIAQFPTRERQAPTAPATLRSLVFAARPELARIDDRRAPTLTAESARGGAATLELQSRCPFKAQAQLRLKADPLPRVSLGVDAPDRGAILHQVLEDLWGTLRTQAALLALSDAELAARVSESAQRFAIAALRPDTRVRERLAHLEVLSTIRQVLTLLDIEKQRPPFAVRFAEAAERYEIGGLAITLRPDRIDELAEGGELLIDYKLGDANRPNDWLEKTPGRPRRPQLPLYGLAHGDRLRALAFVILAAGKVEYRGWSDGARVGPGVEAYPPPRIRVDLGDAMDWPALLRQWRFTLTKLAESFVAGEASVDPLRGECDTCHLSTLCRIHELDLVERLELDDE